MLLCDLVSSRQLVAWHRPFCVDLEESTFTYLCNFLKCYCDGLENDTPPTPFTSKRCVIQRTLYSFRLNCVKCTAVPCSHRDNAVSCVTQGPPPVYFAVHEAAVHSLVLGPCWGHWGDGSGDSGEAPQEPPL